MIELMQRFAAGLMNRVRVNRKEHGIQNGVPVFVKRRVGSTLLFGSPTDCWLLHEVGSASLFVPMSGWIGKRIAQVCFIPIDLA